MTKHREVTHLRFKAKGHLSRHGAEQKAICVRTGWPGAVTSAHVDDERHIGRTNLTCTFAGLSQHIFHKQLTHHEAGTATLTLIFQMEKLSPCAQTCMNSMAGVFSSKIGRTTSDARVLHMRRPFRVPRGFVLQRQGFRDIECCGAPSFSAGAGSLISPMLFGSKPPRPLRPSTYRMHILLCQPPLSRSPVTLCSCNMATRKICDYKLRASS